MEAVSRPDFEPLADLPVEEPIAKGLPSGHGSSMSAPVASAVKGGNLDSDDDLLSHGALLDSGIDAPPASTPAAPLALENRPGAALTPPNVSEAGELLDPEVLLGVSEPGAPARIDGTNGLGTLGLGSGVLGAGLARTGSTGVGVAGAPAVGGQTAGASTSPSAPTGSAASGAARAAAAAKIRAAAAATAVRKAGATKTGTPSLGVTTGQAPIGSSAASRAGATLAGTAKPITTPTSSTPASAGKAPSAATSSARSTPSSDTATTGSKKAVPSESVAYAKTTAEATPTVAVPQSSAPTFGSPFQEALPDLPVELMDDPLAVAAPPPGMVVPTFPTPPAASATASTVSVPLGFVPSGGSPAMPSAGTSPMPPVSADSVIPTLLNAATVNTPPTASSAPSVPVAPPAVPVSPPTATSATTSASTASAAANPAMDRDFIARNQIVERYLSGRLPLKGATDFERFCKDNPEVLDELGLPERVNAGLRLLEASGKPEPWQEKASQRFWTRPQFALGLAGAVVVLGISLAFMASAVSSRNQKITRLEQQTAERPLNPATSTRVIRLVPSHEAASNTPAVVIGGDPTELVDFKIDETRSAYKTFRITIDRIDQGRVAILHNLVKDSNGHLRVALNSSALGPGNYQLTIEGLSWRGDPEPDSWVTIGILAAKR